MKLKIPTQLLSADLADKREESLLARRKRTQREKMESGVADQGLKIRVNAVNDIRGRVFGKLTPVFIAEKRKCGLRWLFQCDCGNRKIMFVSCAKKTGHCGCDKKPNSKPKHGMAKSPIYKLWNAMKARCINKNHPSFENYGGRGITVCDRWLDFGNFYSDMGCRPENLSLERKDNSLGYSPENCIWATRKEQQRNRRGNRIINGKTVAEWSEITGLTYKTISGRLSRGIAPEEAIKP